MMITYDQTMKGGVLGMSKCKHILTPMLLKNNDIWVVPTTVSRLNYGFLLKFVGTCLREVLCPEQILHTICHFLLQLNPLACIPFKMD